MLVMSCFETGKIQSMLSVLECLTPRSFIWVFQLWCERKLLRNVTFSMAVNIALKFSQSHPFLPLALQLLPSSSSLAVSHTLYVLVPRCESRCESSRRVWDLKLFRAPPSPPLLAKHRVQLALILYVGPGIWNYSIPKPWRETGKK